MPYKEASDFSADIRHLFRLGWLQNLSDAYPVLSEILDWEILNWKMSLRLSEFPRHDSDIRLDETEGTLLFLSSSAQPQTPPYSPLGKPSASHLHRQSEH
ncbi:Hypothetical protein NTJ_01353 [Nesidiocoris tenuis]|uniref:Uncharacterized protein n=1 Tax=Nesidiocoris tenuis TaxID=355587 RepID=A0ABN7ABF5_9HEMI|nr:Hypothetical protein NTJ_01353 [Nesidiocoris tenuis]